MMTVETDTTRWAAELREHGLKATPQRLAVLEILTRAGRHLAAADVYEQARRVLPGTGMATVYRTLELLANLGLVVRMHLEDGCHRYAPASAGHRHQLVCRDCGRVVEFEDCALTNIAQRLAQRTNFAIEGHWLQFFGRCGTCAGAGE